MNCRNCDRGNPELRPGECRSPKRKTGAPKRKFKFEPKVQIRAVLTANQRRQKNATNWCDFGTNTRARPIRRARRGHVTGLAAVSFGNVAVSPDYSLGPRYAPTASPGPRGLAAPHQPAGPRSVHTFTHTGQFNRAGLTG